MPTPCRRAARAVLALAAGLTAALVEGQAPAATGATAAAELTEADRWAQVLQETLAAARSGDLGTSGGHLAAAERLLDEGGWPRVSAPHQRWLLAAGRIRHAQTDLGDARRYFERAVSREPAWAEAWLALGTVFETIAQLPDPRLAVRLQTDRGVFERTRRAEVTAQARRCYREALEAQPDLHEARLRLGHVLQLRGETAAARTELERVAAGGAPDDLRYLARLFLGDLAEARRDWAGAVAHYRAAVELEPQAISARLALSASRGLADDPAAATHEALTVLETRGADPERDPWWTYLRPGRHQVAAALSALRLEVAGRPLSGGVAP